MSLSEVGGLQVRTLDATTVKEPGKTGSLWFVYYSVRLPSLTCEFFRLTETFEVDTGRASSSSRSRPEITCRRAESI